MPDDEVGVPVVAEEKDLRRLQLRVDVVDEPAVPNARMLERVRHRLGEGPCAEQLHLVVVAE